jgi:post-segregation antitoxin (ccd killing protein)
VGDYVAIAAKVSRKLKNLVDKLEIKLGPVIRKALKEEVKRRAIKSWRKEQKSFLRGYLRFQMGR